MNNLKTKTKNVMIVLSVVLFVFIAISIYLIFLANSKKSEIVEFKKIINENSDVPSSISDFKNKTNEIDLVSQRVDSLYIPKDRAVSFIEDLEILAQRNGVKIEMTGVDIKDEQVSPNKRNLSYGFLSMLVSVNGSWGGVTGFLESVEKLPYGIKIDSSKISFNQSGSTWNLSFSLKAITQ